MSSSAKETLFITSLVLLWYSANIGVLLLNKFLLSNYGFRFPIFLTMCHMSACALLSYVSIAFFKLVPLQRIKSWAQFVRIATLSVVFCGSVVGGNISLRYLPVSFNQAVGATTPFFTAVFAYFMTLKREAWVTYAALVPVVAGVVIASGGEPSFHLFGFVMCISATAARAFKSVLQGILLSSEGFGFVTGRDKEKRKWDLRICLRSDDRAATSIVTVVKALICALHCHILFYFAPEQSNFVVMNQTHGVSTTVMMGAHCGITRGEKLNSMNLLLYMSPIAVLVLLPATLVMEPDVLDVALSLGGKHRWMWLLLCINSVAAYLANLSNFLVTKHTSALTLQVLGNAKGAVAVVISILLFRNPVTFVGIGGYTITVMGVVAYGETKRRFK